ncbi:MAG: RdgB/HAM1 family non-canonical purine NTP pyrophosphatase [Bacteroidota bacterium]
MNLIFATNNINKAKELQHLVGDSVTIKTLIEIGCLEEIVENGKTLTENASIKSNYVFNHFNMNCFADDTGLLVESLNGEPGIYSARYAGEQKDAGDNMDLLLKNLSNIKNRRASFMTVISLKINDKEYFFEGELKGEIALEKSGNGGFGYDPIFIPEGYSKSLAELSLDEKNKISHRAKAFNKLKDFLVQNNIN